MTEPAIEAGTAETCHHTTTRTRPGEYGAWCENCGIKVWNLETEPCGACAHYQPHDEAAGRCRKTGMIVKASRLISYTILAGSCFKARTNE